MRTQVGTVELLESRIYPRYPAPYARGVEVQLTTAMPFVEVEPGLWPVYRDDETELLYWEMNGQSIRLEPTFRSLGDGTFLSRMERRYDGDEVIFRSVSLSLDEFREFATTDPVALPGDARRLVFDVDV